MNAFIARRPIRVMIAGLLLAFGPGGMPPAAASAGPAAGEPTLSPPAGPSSHFPAADRAAPDPITVMGTSDTAIAAGSSHTCALTASGGVKC